MCKIYPELESEQILYVIFVIHRGLGAEERRRLETKIAELEEELEDTQSSLESMSGEKQRTNQQLLSVQEELSASNDERQKLESNKATQDRAVSFVNVLSLH